LEILGLNKLICLPFMIRTVLSVFCRTRLFLIPLILLYGLSCSNKDEERLSIDSPADSEVGASIRPPSTQKSFRTIAIADGLVVNFDEESEELARWLGAYSKHWSWLRENGLAIEPVRIELVDRGFGGPVQYGESFNHILVNVNFSAELNPEMLQSVLTASACFSDPHVTEVLKHPLYQRESLLQLANICSFAIYSANAAEDQDVKNLICEIVPRAFSPNIDFARDELLSLVGKSLNCISADSIREVIWKLRARTEATTNSPRSIAIGSGGPSPSSLKSPSPKGQKPLITDY